VIISAALILLRMASDRPETIAVTTSITNTTVTTTTSTTTTTTTTTTAPELYDIPLPDELQLYTINVCKQYGVDPELVFALMGVESEYRPDVISCTNDYGLMQINRCNHKWLSDKLGITDFLDPQQNILAGVYMLREISKEYSRLEDVLVVYARGPGGAKKLWRKGVRKTEHTKKVLERMSNLKRREV
jgi:soluble lytic murein transglycosylase-like protein